MREVTGSPESPCRMKIGGLPGEDDRPVLKKVSPKNSKFIAERA